MSKASLQQVIQSALKRAPIAKDRSPFDLAVKTESWTSPVEMPVTEPSELNE